MKSNLELFLERYSGPVIGAGLLGGLWFGNVGALVGVSVMLVIALTDRSKKG